MSESSTTRILVGPAFNGAFLILAFGVEVLFEEVVQANFLEGLDDKVNRASLNAFGQLFFRP